MSKGLARYEKEGMCSFLLVNKAVIVPLLKTLTGHYYDGDERAAIGYILKVKNVKSIKSFLMKKAVTRNMLLKYLFSVNIWVKRDTQKSKLVDKIRSYWKEKIGKLENLEELKKNHVKKNKTLKHATKEKKKNIPGQSMFGTTQIVKNSEQTQRQETFVPGTSRSIINSGSSDYSMFRTTQSINKSGTSTSTSRSSNDSMLKATQNINKPFPSPPAVNFVLEERQNINKSEQTATRNINKPFPSPPVANFIFGDRQTIKNSEPTQRQETLGLGTTRTISNSGSNGNSLFAPPSNITETWAFGRRMN